MVDKKKFRNNYYLIKLCYFKLFVMEKIYMSTVRLMECLN